MPPWALSRRRLDVQQRWPAGDVAAPLTVGNVLGLTSPARVDREAAVRTFPIAWTPLDVGLRALAGR